MTGITKFLNLFFRAAFWALLTTLVHVSCVREADQAAGHAIASPEQSSEGLLQSANNYMHTSKYDSALMHYQSAGRMLQKDEKWASYFETLLKIIEIQRMQGKSDSVEAGIQQAETILSEHLNKNKTYHADLQHRQGLLLLDKSALDSAVLMFNQSIENRIAATGANDTSLALSYNGLGTIDFYRNDYDAALEHYNKAYVLASQRKNPEDADLSRYLQNIGIIYAQKGDFDKAQNAMEKSMDITEKISDPLDPDLANRYLNTGRFLSLINKDDIALPYYDKSENILLKKLTPNHPDIGILYQNKGQIYVHMGDYEKALLYFKKALAIIEKNYESGSKQRQAINMNIGYALEKKGEFTQALAYYKASIPTDTISESAIKPFINLASLYTSMNNANLAEEYFLKSIQLAVKFWGDSHPETALLYTRFGYFQLLESRSDLGLKMFSQALDISKSNFGIVSREVSNNFSHIGTYYITTASPLHALRYFHKATIAMLPDFKDTTLLANPDEAMLIPDRYLINALNGKANALFIMGKAEGNTELMQKSLETYQLSVKAVEKLRAMYQNEESKLQISEDERSTFLQTVKVAVELYKMSGEIQYAEQAFKYADKAKSAVLLSSMLDVEAREFGKIPANILKLENQLKLDLGSYARYIYEEQLLQNPNNEKIRLWEAREFEIRVKYDSLIRFLENEYPEYHTLKYKEPELNIQEIKDNLEPGRTLIEYAFADTMLYTFVVNKDKFDVISRRISPQFRENIQAITSSTQADGFMSIQKSDYLRYIRAAYALYNDLLEPLSSVSQDKKLIIVPDAEIGYISFDLLLTAAGDSSTMNFKNLPFLIYSHTISYSTSAALQYSGIHKNERKPSRNLLTLAPSYDNLTDLEEDGFVDEEGNTVYLLPIPGVENEIRQIRKILSGTSLLGEKTTEVAFKKRASKYNILHFAMHTLINNEKPMLSKLVFYQDGDSIEDGMLNTYELFGMDLNAGLAVLSACNTGSGKLLKGEGIMSLARGFMYAGVPGIVMTMWAVEDQASAQIVTSFYSYLDKGMPKDEALRQSKLDMLAEGNMLRSHPYYWAAYVTIGDYSPMKFAKPLWLNVLYLLISIAAVASLISLLVNRYRDSKLLKQKA